MMIYTFKTAALSAVLALGLTGAASAQDLKFFTIGTGGTSFTYYPVGGVIANAISRPPGSRECGEGGSCGVEGLIASAVSSRGSVDNINAIVSGLRDSGFAQSDVAYWAYTGTGTQWLPHDCADRSKLGRGSHGKSDDESGLYASTDHIQQLMSGDVALLKGEMWAGNEGAGLIHRSPTASSTTASEIF